MKLQSRGITIPSPQSFPIRERSKSTTAGSPTKRQKTIPISPFLTQDGRVLHSDTMFLFLKIELRFFLTESSIYEYSRAMPIQAKVPVKIAGRNRIGMVMNDVFNRVNSQEGRTICRGIPVFLRSNLDKNGDFVEGKNCMFCDFGGAIAAVQYIKWISGQTAADRQKMIERLAEESNRIYDMYKEIFDREYAN